MKRIARNAATVLLIAGLLGGIGLLQQRLTGAKDRSWFGERMSYLPQTDRLKPFLLGFQTTYANYLWIRTMLYFGSHYEGDRDFQWLTNMVDIITRLNPQFYPAYEFAGLMLPSHVGNPDAARIILNRGLDNLVEKKHKMAFYLAYLYYNSYHDYEQAANYMAMAASTPGRPAYYAGLTATFYKRAGQVDMARDFLYSLYETSENPSVKLTIEKKLAELPAQ